MPLDPTVKMILDAMAEAGFDFTSGTPQEVREAMKAGSAIPKGDPIELPSIEDITIPGPAGEIPARVYRAGLDGTRPTIVFFHGGGWVIGDLETHDQTCRAMARDTDAVVVAVDYRLAPENRFPAAVEDCYAATCWAATNVGTLGGNADQLVVAGDSAGGNLAAVVSLRARDDAAGPQLAFQLLIYPVTGSPWDDRASYTENGEGYMLTHEAMIWFADHYLGDDSAARANPWFAPIVAPDLSGLPPAHVMTAEFDPLRDEGEAYAARLAAAGVPATMTRYDGIIHGFMGFAAILPQARQAQLDAAAAIRSSLGLPTG